MAAKLAHLNLRPDERTLKQFGFIALVGFGLLATCAFFETGMFAFGLGPARTTVALAFAALGVFAAGASLVQPEANRFLYIGVSVLAFPIGFVLSYLLLGLLFFGVIAPTGALLRAFGKDPMQRSFRRDQATYWNVSHPGRSKKSYFRQF